MLQTFLDLPAEAQKPDYKIYSFTEQIYKIVKFRCTLPRVPKLEKGESVSYDKKLDSSLSRARRVCLEVALCNSWVYFCTFTINKNKYDRYDLDSWYKSFSQWLRDQRKKYKIEIQFLLVPEQHKDGAWHMHGLFSDISPLLVSFADLAASGVDVPDKLSEGCYYNWLDYQRKFGFCSFGKIKNPVAVSFYITKYVTKQLQARSADVGAHLYYCSQGLNRSSLHGDIYGYCQYLDKFLDRHYDFCSTGFTHLDDGCTWDFALEYMDYDLMSPLAISDPIECPEVDNYFECVQTSLFD